jgi:RimJ/RimL family protein N-acetyltransferase
MSWAGLKSVVLENSAVTLRRICLSDRAEFARIAFEPDIWQYFTTVIATGRDLDAFVEEAIRDNLLGTRAVFAIIERKSGRIAGSTAYGNMVEKERKLEIGWSWLGRDFRGTGINRAAKFLLMDYAFGVLACERVEFKTDMLNLRARRGLEAIGATAEGVLRSFNYMPGGRRRNAIYYSVLKAEWPAIRERWHKTPALGHKAVAIA